MLKIDALKHNFQRMLESINGLGEKNYEKWNIFGMVESFNSQGDCPNVRFVVDPREIID